MTALARYLGGRPPRPNPETDLVTGGVLREGPWLISARPAALDPEDAPYAEVGEAASYEDALAEVLAPPRPLAPLTLLRLTNGGWADDDFWFVRPDGRPARLPPIAEVGRKARAEIAAWTGPADRNWEGFWRRCRRSDWLLDLAEATGHLAAPALRAAVSVAWRGARAGLSPRVDTRLNGLLMTLATVDATPDAPDVRWSAAVQRVLASAAELERAEPTTDETRVLAAFEELSRDRDGSLGCPLSAVAEAVAEDVADAAAPGPRPRTTAAQRKAYSEAYMDEIRVQAYRVGERIPVAALCVALTEGA